MKCMDVNISICATEVIKKCTCETCHFFLNHLQLINFKWQGDEEHVPSFGNFCYHIIKSCALDTTWQVLKGVETSAEAD
jgi:hypothetical protein